MQSANGKRSVRSLPLMSIATALALVAIASCGPGDGPVTEAQPEPPKPPQVVGSCAGKDGICLNYVKPPTGSSVADLRDLCDGNRVWSDDACKSDNVYAQCDVKHDGGQVITWFALPFLEGDAVESCSSQGGTYQSF